MWMRYRPGMGEPGRPPGLTIVDVSTPEALSRA